MDAFNRRDVDALMEFTTFELFPALAGSVEGGSFRGREGMEAYFEASKDTWEELRLIAEEIRDLGDRVLWLGRAVDVDAAAASRSPRQWARSKIFATA